MSRPAAKQFVVGDKAAGADFSKEEIEALIYKIALWFTSDACDRTYDDPAAAARQKVTECLLAQKESGDPWANCPKDFNDRLRSKCGYDMVKGVGIPSTRAKHPLAARALDPEAQKAAKDLKGANAVATSFDQEAFRAKVEGDILGAFPELDNPAHRPNVRSLSGLYAQREVIDRELSLGVPAAKRELLLKSLKMIEEMADGTMRRLGVHPDQVRKKISEKGASSVADLSARVGDDDDYRKREKVWALQFALQCWWMSEHHDGRRSGPQLHDFEIWHMTRSRPLRHRCKCGYECVLVEGFEPRELHAWLVAEGVLIEEPVLPGLISKDDLAGLSDHFTDDLTQDGNYGAEADDALGAGAATDRGVPRD